MNFEKEILKNKNKVIKEPYKFKKGNIPVILTSVHTMKQKKKDKIKLKEPFTREINEYVSSKVDSFSYIKLIDTGIDSNSDNKEEFKDTLLKVVKENDIKLIIDIHGAKLERDFDIELGTLNNLSADYSCIKELKEAFKHNGLNKIEINNPFKGGGITRYIYSNTHVDIIQIEINKKYRSIDNLENVEKVCDSLIYFIEQYNDVLNKN